MKALKKIIKSQRGQGFVELALMLPLLVLMVLGTIEISNMINSYLVLTHLTREGASLTSRGATPDVGGLNCGSPDDALDAIIIAAAPTIQCNKPTEWEVIYSQIVPENPGDPLSKYKIVHPADWVRGNFAQPSKIGNDGAEPNIPDIASITSGQTFHVVEVFFQYSPLTPLQNFIGLFPTVFYERAIFTQ